MARKNVQYQYDANGNRTLLVTPDGGRFTYAYDKLNRLTSLVNPESDHTTFVYDSINRLTQIYLANGTRASYLYDAADNLSTLGNLKSNGNVISLFNYRYDNSGHRLVMNDHNNTCVTWTYDNIYQLKSEYRTGSNAFRNSFSYDPAGNRTIKNEDSIRTSYSYDSANQLLTSKGISGTTTFAFDSNGNQVLFISPGGNRTTTLWDFENRISNIELPTGVRNTMSYNTDGLRISLQDSSGTKKFIWDQYSYLAEADAGNSIQVVYTNSLNVSNNLISKRNSTTSSWYHYDAVGSTTELSDTTGNVTDEYIYDSWGDSIYSSEITANPFRYIGKSGYFYDEESENYYVRLRTYQPNLARWASEDPLGLYYSDKPYIYAANDPVNTIDSLGLKEFKADIVAKSFINGVPQVGSLPPWRFSSFPFSIPTLARFILSFYGYYLDHGELLNILYKYPLNTPTQRLHVFANISLGTPAFNQSPITDEKDGKYRLYSRARVTYCCRNGNLTDDYVSHRDDDGGIENERLNIKGTMAVDKFNYVRVSPSTARISWLGYGRPNDKAEPAFNWVAYRTSLYIWHYPVVEIYCVGNSGSHRVLSFEGSGFPSRRLWINGTRVKDIAQGELSNLWIPEPGAITFVKRGP